MHPEIRYFFDQGLSFECQGCGVCCTGAPGTIYVAQEEIGAIAKHLGLGVSDFIARYLYPYKDSFSIGEDVRGNCLLFHEGCRVYPVRPFQCRAFPFWFSNVRSESRWKKIARQCPGIGRGRRYSKEEIIVIARKTMKI